MSQDHEQSSTDEEIIGLLRLIHSDLHKFHKENIVNNAELTAALQAVSTDLTSFGAEADKSFTELTEKIDALQAIVDAGGSNVPQTVIDALTDVQTKASALGGSLKKLDDIVPDQPTA